VARGYYQRLSKRGQAIYRASAAIERIDLGDPNPFHGIVAQLRTALEAGDPRGLQGRAQALANATTARLSLPAVRVEVLAVRPNASWGELHGLYEQPPGRAPVITLWMRTAKHARVVAFKTFLRTLAHEMGHHIDYAHLKLADSLHTPGFFKRESSLVRQWVPRTVGRAAPTTSAPAAAASREHGRAALAALRAKLNRPIE
jgi:hypothetical protein